MKDSHFLTIHDKVSSYFIFKKRHVKNEWLIGHAKLFQMKMQKPSLKEIKNQKFSYANGVIFLNLSLRGGTYDQQSTEWAQVCLFPQFNRVRKFGRLRWAQRSSVQRRSHQNACWAHQWPTELSRDQQRCRQNVNWATLLNSFVQQTVAKTRLV